LPFVWFIFLKLALGGFVGETMFSFTKTIRVLPVSAMKQQLYQALLPGSPLNGPAKSGVIQPP
jgi:hypothetical protein